jgi:histidine triad (HIT) family protein
VAGRDCLFCAIAAGTEPAHTVVDEPEVVAFLDHRPVFKGHVLVIPRAHVVTLPELEPELLTAVFVVVQR